MLLDLGVGRALSEALRRHAGAPPAGASRQLSRAGSAGLAAKAATREGGAVRAAALLCAAALALGVRYPEGDHDQDPVTALLRDRRFWPAGAQPAKH